MRPYGDPKRAVKLIAMGKFAEALEMIVRMPVLALLDLDALYEAWAHDGQLAPSGEGWRTWLMQGGREWTTTTGNLTIPPTELAAFGRGAAMLSVVQVGDRAASRATHLDIIL